MGREDEGSDLWEWETPRGLFLWSHQFCGDLTQNPENTRLEIVLLLIRRGKGCPWSF